MKILFTTATEKIRNTPRNKFNVNWGKSPIGDWKTPRKTAVEVTGRKPDCPWPGRPCSTQRLFSRPNKIPASIFIALDELTGVPTGRHTDGYVQENTEHRQRTSSSIDESRGEALTPATTRWVSNTVELTGARHRGHTGTFHS